MAFPSSQGPRLGLITGLLLCSCRHLPFVSAFAPSQTALVSISLSSSTSSSLSQSSSPVSFIGHRRRHHLSRPLPSTKMNAANTNDDKGGRNIVIIGGGIQGTSIAFHLHRKLSDSGRDSNASITILEATALASAASGKGGGFMARSWGNGSVTQRLHELAFDSYERLCSGDDAILHVESYRKLPVLSVSPGPDSEPSAKKAKTSGGNKNKENNPSMADIVPEWLDGSIGRISPLGYGDDTAQVTPKEFVEKMMEYVNRPEEKEKGPGVNIVVGKCVGVDYENGDGDDSGEKVVKGVIYVTTSTTDGSDDDEKEEYLTATDVIVAAGPWACQAEEWFEGAVQLPMEGVKSTSIVWKPPVDEEGNLRKEAVDATALFCGEDYRFGTHLEVYPRPDGTIYICGIGGSDYITTSELQSSAFLTNCPPKPDRIDAAKSAFQLMSATYATQGELSHAQACMRPCPPDALPYMGRVPGYRGGYINAGHNCWGIAWAPACGMAMAELVLEGECSCLDLRPFDPARFTVGKGRGGRGRKKGSVSVGEQW
mmetsp:Transcript_26295/g.55078  ORF Transcript_26295/g.55078 Transcript_26295/m.55078 type:complete len:541 (-) Transcript_26295:166-1788(-)